MAPSPTVDPLSTTEPDAIRQLSPIVAPSMWALCPTTQPAPITVGSTGVQWITVPSWMFVRAPTLIVP